MLDSQSIPDGSAEPIPSQEHVRSGLALILRSSYECTPLAADHLADQLYELAWRDYQTYGAIYGSSHAGLMQWLASVVGMATPSNDQSRGDVVS